MPRSSGELPSPSRGGMTLKLFADQVVDFTLLVIANNLVDQSESKLKTLPLTSKQHVISCGRVPHHLFRKLKLLLVDQRNELFNHLVAALPNLVATGAFFGA